MTHAVHIRQAGFSDVPVLTAMGRATFLEAFAKDNTKENMDIFLDAQFQEPVLAAEMSEAGTAFFMVFLEGTPIGFSKVRTGHDPPDLWEGAGVSPGAALEVERIYVVAAHQAKKIGSEIMDYNIAFARAHHFNLIWLGVWERNTAAIRFYERLGFAKFGSHLFMLGNDPQTDILMRLQI